MNDIRINRPAAPAWAWVAVGLLALLMFFSSLSAAPFIDRDEGEYATVARNMVQRSDYVIPQVNGRAYYEKPALYFWLMAGSFRAFGWNEAAARLPSAASALLLTALMAWFGRRHGGDFLGLLAAMVTVTSILIVLLARVAIMDMTLTLFTTATLFFYYEGYISPSGKGRPYYLAAWAAMGLAFLTKGPVGAMLPLLSVFCLTVANRDLWSEIKRAQFLPGLVIFLLIAGPWYLLAFLREGRRFWEGFFISQNVGRFTDVVLGHGAPLWFYLPVLAVLAWPWAAFAVHPLWRSVVKTPRAMRVEVPDARLDFFLSVWLLSSLFLLSLAATKQPNYIMPAVPPLLLLAARWWQERLAGACIRSRSLVVLFGFTAFIGAIVAVFLVVVGFLFPYALQQAKAGVNPDSFEYAFQAGPPDLGLVTPLTGLLMIGAIAAALVFAKKYRLRESLLSLALAGMIFSTGLLNFAAPAMLTYLQTPARTLAYDVRNEIRPGENLASFGLYKPTLWFYTDHHILRIKTTETSQLQQYLAAREKGYLLSRASLLPELEKFPEFRLLRTEGGYILGDNGGGAAR